jgi:hypothetical protein
MRREDDLSSFQEERATLERWRKYSYYVIASLLEVCAACDRVREKGHLTRCRRCQDVYYCKDGACAYIHHAHAHPPDALWLR